MYKSWRFTLGQFIQSALIDQYISGLIQWIQLAVAVELTFKNESALSGAQTLNMVPSR